MGNNNISMAKNQAIIGFEAVPDELKRLDQWVLWRYGKKGGKPSKIPYDAGKQQRASITDSNTWCSFSTACHLFAENSQKYEGIGFVLSADDPYVGIDFDDCLEDGELKPWARELVKLVFPTYTEISPSGNGIKMWLRAEKNRPENRTSVDDGGIEIYNQGRYFTVTGKLLGEATTVAQDQAGLDQLMQKVWGNPKPKTTPQRKPQARNLDDSTLLDIAMKDDKFSPLWFGNWESNTDSYNTNYPSQSEADLALCAKLAFYWGRDFNAIDRMFRQSGLYRPKWDRDDYRLMTMDKALEGVESRDFTRGSLVFDNERESPDELLESNSVFPVGENLPKTDEHFAEEFIHLHGKDVLWCQIWGKWLVWDGQRWEVDDKLQVNNLARGVNKHFLERASKEDDPKTQNLLIDYARSAAAATRMNAFLSLVKAQVGVSPDELDADLMLLNTPVGTVDLTTGEIKAHERKDKITRITKASCENLDVTCPRWTLFLREILSGDSETIDFMQRAIGYALTGEIRENVLFIMHGDGANGKTTLVETVMHVLGDYAKSAAPDLLLQRRNESHPTGVADLMGARFVSSVEVDDGRRLNESLVKRLTGRDTIKARFMRQDFFDFIPSHKLFLAVNHRPEIQGTDKGIWRRIRLVPFEVEIAEEKQDPKLLDKLIEEAPGILAWAVSGCLKWQQSGLGMPSAVKEASQAYREESDVVGRFIDECCQIDESYKITKRELYDFYKEWCEKNGERHQTSKKFGGLIKKRRQFNEKRGRVDDKVVRFWVGLKLADDAFDDEGVLDFGNTMESSESKGSDTFSEQTLPSDHVRQEEITSRSVYKKTAATSGNIDEKTSEESSDSKGSSVLPKSKKAENESGNNEDETVPASLRGKNMMKL